MIKKSVPTLALAMVVLTIISCSVIKEKSPNIIIILADDMGYGDIQSFNSKSEVPTPNLNRLSEEGIMFMDAHTPSSICTPTRYGLLTGRYCWRTSLKKGVLKGYDRPLINDDRITMASYLKGKGYHTGVVGKWHLGLGFQQNIPINNQSDKSFDLTKTLEHTPNDHGFDYSFVLPASLDFEPYLYVCNYEVVDPIFDTVPTTEFPHFWRAGVKSKSLEFNKVLDDLLLEAKDFITQESKTKNPFFLYFPLTAPHKPVIPDEKFIGISGKGLYGDFVSQVDWTSGEIFKLLEELKIDDNTLVIFTSDNGSPMYRIDSTTNPDHVTDETLAFYNVNSHEANGVLSGIKGDVLEGGHRVPFIVRWPAKISGGIQKNETICLTDIFETIIEVTGGEKPPDSAEDSYSFYPILMSEKEIIKRPPVIHHSGNGMFALRNGHWKMIFGNGSGARTKPVGTPFKEPYQLYNLENDISESNNLINLEIEVADQLKSKLIEIRRDD
jgi:arylsulfatase A-like enzyme